MFMQKITNKGRMLVRLLDSSKTTAELAIELGYVKADGIARYNVIVRDLHRLVKDGYVKSEKKRKEMKAGNIPTLYSIDLNIQNLRNLLEEYPYLISSMRRSESVLESILSEHSDLILILSKDKSQEHIDKVKLKEMLGASDKFFELFLMSEKKYLMDIILFAMPSDNDCVSFIDRLFKSCSYMDSLNNAWNVIINSKSVESIAEWNFILSGKKQGLF